MTSTSPASYFPSPASFSFSLSSSTSLLCLPLLFKTSPSCWACWQGFSHSVSTRGKLTCPGQRRSITAHDGTTASALSRIHGSAWRGEKIKEEEGRSSNNSWTIIAAVLLWCVCDTALGLGPRSSGCRWSHVWLPLSVLIATDQHQVTPGEDGRALHPKHATWIFCLHPGQIQRQFSRSTNDSSSVKTCDCQRKMGNCVCKVYQHVANKRIWLLNDCIIHFWTYNVKRGDMEQGRGSGGVEQGRCDRIRGCVKREETRLWEDI